MPINESDVQCCPVYKKKRKAFKNIGILLISNKVLATHLTPDIPTQISKATAIATPCDKFCLYLGAYAFFFIHNLYFRGRSRVMWERLGEY